MIAVIFEVEPKPGQLDAYLDLAATLRPELEKIDGFISVERGFDRGLHLHHAPASLFVAHVEVR